MPIEHLLSSLPFLAVEVGRLSFEFLGPELLTDGVVDLRLSGRKEADPEKGHSPMYEYRITLHGSEVPIGGINLRVGSGPSFLTSGHIGYGVEEAHRGHHYAARACLLIGEVALRHGLTPLLITCAPENIASRRTLERLGGKLLGIYDVPVDHEMYQRGRRKVCRYEWTPQPLSRKGP